MITRPRSTFFASLAIASLFACAGIADAEPTTSQVITAMKWWMDSGGPRLQRALGHTGFRAARQGIPYMIGNVSGFSLTYAVETKSCDWKKHSIKHGDYWEHQCKTTSGDSWFNIKFQDPVSKRRFVYSADAGKAYYFDVDEDGHVDLFMLAD